jgi:F-type H+-transporting ATPase subunit delta
MNVAKETAEGGLAGRYANALFELALEHKAVDAVGADLAALRRALDSSADLTRLVRSPVFSAQDHGKALTAVLAKMGAGELTTKFVLLLASKRRLAALTGIIKAYETQVAKSRGETEAEVTSPRALSDAEITELKPARQGRSLFARRSRRQGGIAHDRLFASHQARWLARGHERVRNGRPSRRNGPLDHFE